MNRLLLITFGIALTLMVVLAATGCESIVGIAGLTVGTGGGSAGACSPVGAKCGGTCADGAYTPPGTCKSDGACSTTPMSCSPYGCDPGGATCASQCTASVGCADGSFCLLKPMACMDCGWSPPSIGCIGPDCESCDGDTCVKSCDSPGECSADLHVPTQPGPPVRVECNDQCNGITVHCDFAVACEVVCGDGGCHDLTLVCGPDGPCKLTCQGSGCSGTINVMCAGNSCAVECKGAPVTVQQQCGQSCSCTKSGCGM